MSCRQWTCTWCNTFTELNHKQIQWYHKHICKCTVTTYHLSCIYPLQFSQWSIHQYIVRPPKRTLHERDNLSKLRHSGPPLYKAQNGWSQSRVPKGVFKKFQTICTLGYYCYHIQLRSCNLYQWSVHLYGGMHEAECNNQDLENLNWSTGENLQSDTPILINLAIVVCFNLQNVY